MAVGFLGALAVLLQQWRHTERVQDALRDRLPWRLPRLPRLARPPWPLSAGPRSQPHGRPGPPFPPGPPRVGEGLPAGPLPLGPGQSGVGVEEPSELAGALTGEPVERPCRDRWAAERLDPRRGLPVTGPQGPGQRIPFSGELLQRQ